MGNDVFLEIVSYLSSLKKSHLLSLKQSYWEKQKNDLVSAADIQIEKSIINIIRKFEPNCKILSEETTKTATDFPKGERVWIIDPIDGTHNFLRDYYHYNSSIGIMEKSNIIAGMIYSFHTGQLFSTEIPNQKLKVSTRTIDEAIVNFDNQKLPLFMTPHFMSRFFSIRISGCASQDCVDIASGKIEARIFTHTHIWDIAAGIALVEKAGGKATDLQGNPITIESKKALISNGIIHDELLALIGEYK